MTNVSDDPQQIRRDIEHTQAALSQDVNALADKVTPARIVSRRVDRVRSTAGRWKDTVMGTSMTSATDRARGNAEQTARTVTDAASSAASTVPEVASDAASTVSDAASSATHTVQQAPQMARRQTQGNPVAAGLVAFGLGWLVSSLLPASRKERQLASQAQDRAQQVTQPLAQAASQAINEVKDNLREPAQQAMQTVKSTATEAGQAVADEGKSAADQVQDSTHEAAGTVQDQTTRR